MQWFVQTLQYSFLGTRLYEKARRASWRGKDWPEKSDTIEAHEEKRGSK
jgi:hypothetical protein